MPYVYHARIVRVVDGDTIDLDVDLGFRLTSRQRLRVLGINAPEKSTPEGVEAARFAADLLPVGTAILVETDRPDPRDKYGRFLATFDLPDGQDFAETMVLGGHAVRYDP